MIPRFAIASIFAAFAVPNTPALAAETYQLDPRHTHVVFSVQRFGFNDVIAFFPEVKGTVLLDEAVPKKSAVHAEIGVASIVSGDAERNEHILGAFWLNATEFPNIKYQSTSVEMTGEYSARVTGDLSLLGKTLPVMLDVTMNKLGTDPATKKKAAGFSATAKLKRSDFGLLTAGPLVGDEVSIRIETLAHLTE